MEEEPAEDEQPVKEETKAPSNSDRRYTSVIDAKQVDVEVAQPESEDSNHEMTPE